MNAGSLYPCPCCGYLVFEEPPGSLDICPVCWWEDDPIQLADPSCRDGANSCCLIDAQQRFRRRDPQAADPSACVHPRNPAFRRDKAWRPLPMDDEDDCRPLTLRRQGDWPDDPAMLYYWHQNRRAG